MLKELQLAREARRQPGEALRGACSAARRWGTRSTFVEALLQVVDTLCIGGAMANTFLAAQGKNMQKSRIEEDKLPLARTHPRIKAPRSGTSRCAADGRGRGASLDATEGQVSAVDADPRRARWRSTSGRRRSRRSAARWPMAKTISGTAPMGLFETAAFSKGTFDLARVMSGGSGFTVVGGGDSASALKKAGEEIAKGFNHISTGGGASLELIEGKKLPGVEALRTNQPAE
jgi:phosphoglycerate kinase